MNSAGPCTELREWLSDVLKQSVIVVTIVKCSEETFGLLISKFVPEFQEERAKIIVLLIFQFQRFV